MDFFTKEDILSLFSSIVTTNYSSAGFRSAAYSGGNVGKCIMIVDDSSAIRQSLGYVLKNGGYDVIEASDGVDALSKIMGSAVNLVICDVNMPNMDGITFVKTLKADAKYASMKFVPVVMLTTESGEDKKNAGKEAGVKAWMTKPFPPESILDAVQKLIP